MTPKKKETSEKEVKCIDCSRVMRIKDKGLQWHRNGTSVTFGWDTCQVCGNIICLDCANYSRVKKKGFHDYYYEVQRVCKDHSSPKKKV